MASRCKAPRDRHSARSSRKHSAARKHDIHPFFVIGGKLHQGKKAIIGEGGGPLGGGWDPFRLEYDPATGTKVPALQLPPDLTLERLADRQQLLAAARQRRPARERTRFRRARSTRTAGALAMLTSRTAAAGFDLSKEKDTTRDAYGRTRFGQSCLLARPAGRSRSAVRAGELERPR